MPTPPPRPGHASKKRSVIWLILGALGLFLILIVVAGVSSLWRPVPVFEVPGAQRIMLADGTELFVQVTYGENHEWLAKRPETDPFRRFFRPSIPVSESRFTGDGAYVIWLTGIHPATGQVSDLTWWSHSSVVDQYGDEIRDGELHWNTWRFQPHGGSSSTSSSSSRPLKPLEGETSLYLVNTQLRPFHTNQTNFTLRLHDLDGSVVASFNLPVQHAVPAAKWIPEPLPATKSQGDLAVTLNRVQFERSNYQSDEEQMGIRVTPRFEATWKGEPSTHWNSWSEVHDSLGNHDETYNVRLSPRTEAWLLKLRLCRSEGATFAPEEQWQAASFAIPASGQHRLLSGQVSVQGANISIRAIGGGGTLNYDLPGTARSSSQFSSSGSFQLEGKQMPFSIKRSQQANAASVTVECEAVHMAIESKLGANQRLNVRAIDDQGRNVPVSDRDYNGFHVVFMAVQPDAKSVQPTFIVHDEQTVEFYIDPPNDLIEATAN